MKLRHTLIPALACMSFIWSSCSSDSDIKPEPKTGMATITLNRPSKLQAAVAAAKPPGRSEALRYAHTETGTETRKCHNTRTLTVQAVVGNPDRPKPQPSLQRGDTRPARQQGDMEV